MQNQYPHQYWSAPDTIPDLQNTIRMQNDRINELEGRIAQLEAMMFSNFYVSQQNTLFQCQQVVMPKYDAAIQQKYVPQDYLPFVEETESAKCQKTHLKQPRDDASCVLQPEVQQKNMTGEHVAQERKSLSSCGRSRDVALDLRASVCKVLWVNYDELANCSRVPSSLQEIYMSDWGSFKLSDYERVIETQLRFLRMARAKVWEEKKYEIAAILKKEGYHSSTKLVPSKDDVIKYLVDQGYKEKHQRSKKRGGHGGMSLLEIWREFGQPLSDQRQREGTLKLAAPDDMHQEPRTRPKKTPWDKLNILKEKIAMVFQCSVNDLDVLEEIPEKLRTFYRKDLAAQRESTQNELDAIIDEQNKLLKSNQDILTIMNQRGTIKRLMRLDDLRDVNQELPHKLQKLYQQGTLIFKLSFDRRKQVKQQQQEFISQYREQVIAPVKSELSSLLRERGYSPALQNEVLNTSQIRYYFRSIDFVEWKQIREDSLQEMNSKLKLFLEQADKTKKTDRASVDLLPNLVHIPTNKMRRCRSTDSEKAELIEALQTPLDTIDEYEKSREKSFEVRTHHPHHRSATQPRSATTMHRMSSACSQASSHSKMGWASEMSYYDDNPDNISISYRTLADPSEDVVNGGADGSGKKPFYALGCV